MRPCLVSLFIFVLHAFPSLRPAEAAIHIPTDQPTIQAGINSASAGDSVLVAPGTYFENLNMKSGVSLISDTGPSATIIDGQDLASVITCAAISNSLISGFTIQHGHGSGGGAIFGGGIYCDNCASSLVIENNLIRACRSFEGGGIAVINGAPTITDNVVEHNVVTIIGPQASGIGGGIHVGAGSPLIARNILRFNESDRGALRSIRIRSRQRQLFRTTSSTATMTMTSLWTSRGRFS